MIIKPSTIGNYEGDVKESMLLISALEVSLQISQFTHFICYFFFIRKPI